MGLHGGREAGAGVVLERRDVTRTPALRGRMLLFERGLCPRKPVRGEGRKGGGAPPRGE
jgi:hypothetical protein